ncbi:chemotaxis protein CheD [Methyloversatilis sp.]|uniref:chemotaxis protein CheD n=1 Tax=Methyloversatilis sp. TaxID=2569862 RepID=UPI0027350E0E|nr:chemotaxis protein CheD [Methyloversatilis sp.]MDP2869064.1 chemotaxis protein CheD [Methyloversatilis sp.]MDP3289794.1 chemotaxis protein CheD [Methyloversatilis sp.]MDP3454514.1 chemotaxis protein CheD [Methyloversatilis sp.]MDP3578573.1 chemotaxis protein CheD [Methyloversatilis sp.]
MATEIFLKPGDIVFGDETMCLRTVLGSCVAITMWHPGRRIGGMCHFMLPGGGHTDRAGDELSTRFAEGALNSMVREARRLGTRELDYEFKLFGGGNMFPGFAGSHNVSIGEANVQRAWELLDALGVRRVAEHTGGYGQRVLMMNVSSGVVSMRHDDTCSRAGVNTHGQLPC